MKNKETYEAPQTTAKRVELEQGFMSASVFDPENEQDDGVSIGNHEVGNTGDYSGIGWDEPSTFGSDSF